MEVPFHGDAVHVATEVLRVEPRDREPETCVAEREVIRPVGTGSPKAVLPIGGGHWSRSMSFNVQGLGFMA